MSNFNPGPVVAVGALNPGDTVFLRSRKVQDGLPVPTHPATVATVTPLADGRVRVYARSANSNVAPARLIGDLPATREFRSAVPVV